jgi:P-type E1-E2 ATPase
LIEINVPGQSNYRFEHLVLDFNGTLAIDGKLIAGVPERLNSLRKLIDISIVTADTFGTAQQLAADLGIKINKLNAGDERNQKLELIRKLGVQTTVSVGNGSNDAYMLRESGLGICVIGPEGASSEALANCSLVVPEINAALDLLIKPKRLIATLRK